MRNVLPSMLRSELCGGLVQLVQLCGSKVRSGFRSRRYNRFDCELR
jgi:hypothetical protein